MKKDFITSLIAVAGCASVYTFPAVYIYLTNKDQFAVKTPLVLSVIFAMVKASLLFFERIISQKTGGHKAHRSDDYLLEISF